jgi:clan AA aspartic protease (TIGR02281 family)
MTLRLAAITLALVVLLVSCSSMSREERDQSRAAWNYLQSGDYATAAVLYQPLAIRSGDATAQTNLGWMYLNGKGVPQSDERAAGFFKLAAAQGNAVAQNNLGVMYEAGRGVVRNDAEAARLFKLSADQGNSDARANIARLSVSAPVTPLQSNMSSSVIQMKRSMGTYVVPVLINGAITLDFMVDSGASDVSIPADVVITLMRAGTILDTDFIGEQVYVLADGSKVKSHTFRIRSLRVGDRVLENVIGSIASTKGSLLLGQSFLGRFKSWSIDNSRHALVLE